MTETDLDHPPDQPTADGLAKTPWESIDPPEAAPAARSKKRAKARPVRAKITKRSSKRANPFASALITAAEAGMADLASEIQALVDSPQFSEVRDVVATPAESPEEQAASHAFLSDETNPLTPESAGRPEESPAGPTLADAETAPPPVPGTSVNAEAPETISQPQIDMAPRIPAPSVEPPVQPATIDATPWATMGDETVDATASPTVTAFVDLTGESPPIDLAADPDLSDADLDALDASDSRKLDRADLGSGREVETGTLTASVESIAQTQPDSAEAVILPQVSSDDTVITFAMTDPVAALIPEMGVVSEPQATEEHRPGEATVLVQVPLPNVEQEQTAPAPQIALQPRTQPQTQWLLETEIPLSPVTTGGAWTIPLMCLGIGLIACCMAIPQIDTNRRLRYEQRSLAANLESVQKQVAVNDSFLKKVMDDPTLAERLAGRQMKTIRKGQKVIPLEQGSDDEGMSPFALVAVAPPVEPPPYKPIRGTIADLCYNARSRLYLLGSAMAMVAVGLVMGYGSQPGKDR